MGIETGIAWTDHTFNPWWGCTKVSAGCANCYAETSSNRWGLNIWGKESSRKFFGDKHWKGPLKWDRKAASSGIKSKVFCGSMCDIMEIREDLVAPRKRLFDLVEMTPNLIWLFLTKRPENYLSFLPSSWLDSPRDNVWMMTTVEDEKAKWKIDELSNVPAKVRGLSMEPLLEYVDLDNIDKIDWVIVGGESGNEARPFDPEWGERIIDRCKEKGVATFMKQMGSNVPGYSFVDRKGGDMSEWREDWKIREFPSY